MIKRGIYKEIEKWIGKEKIIILKWARQVGKTTIMKKIQNDLDKQWKKTFFIYADDLSNQNIFNTPDDLLYFLEFKFNIGSLKEKFYLFIDEFQYINNAWLFLKNIFDKHKENIQIIVSGSSSLEITKNTEFLTGRNIEFYIDRINYKEFIEYKIWKEISFNLENINEIRRFYNIFKNDLDRYFLEYLSFGGYPELVDTKTETEKLDILSSIYKNYIEKDIISFLKIENITAFNNLIKILSWQIWNLLNKNELSNTIWLSRVTLDKYLDILKWTFIFDYLPPYFSNIRKELTKMPKVFWNDLGIINYVLWKTLSLKNEIDLWSIVENFVYRELKNKNKLSKLYFYQTVSKSEIDFILEDFEKNLSIIEVKYRKKVQKPAIFNKFQNNYQDLLKNKIIITKDILKFEDWIYYIPACILVFMKDV